jgi:hypothetical protein
MTGLVQIAAVAMAPDASWAVTVAADGTVRTQGPGVTPRVIGRAIPIHDGQPTAVALSGNRLRVLRATGETIRLHENVQGARPRDDDFLASSSVQALALSPSGALGIVACADATLRILNVGTGEFGWPLATKGLTACAVAVASDQGPVVAAFADGSVRRYDLAGQTGDIVGSGPGLHLLAVSPDGETVIAVSVDGALVRWSRSGGAVPDYRVLETAVTAIAVDGEGRKVLASRADGGLWLYDMTGGPAAEFAAPASAAPPAPSAAAPPWWERPQPEEPPPATPVPDAAATTVASVPAWAPPGRGEVDDDVRFTVYRPQTLSPGVWGSLLVFAHKTDLVEKPGKPPLDPAEEVEAIARAHFGNLPVRKAEGDARSGVFRGARLRITADLPGLRCEPASAEFDWREPVHHVVFHLQAGPEKVGSVVRGVVRIWCGPLILGEVSVAISVTAFASAVQPPTVAESAPRYRKIFPSYSRHDRAIVDGFAEIVRTFGDEYLRDVIAIRSGERWRERLPELIEEADVFQLFWSSNSMRSSYCREEWEHALALGRPFFVRPFYWEDPRPEDRANGLPPAALDALEFAKVTFLAGQAGLPPLRGGFAGAGGDYAPASAGYIDAPRQAAPAFGGGTDTGEWPAQEPAPATPPSDWAPRMGQPVQYRRGDNVASTGACPLEPTAPPGGRPKAGTRRGRLVVAGLVLVLIVVAAILAFFLR